MTRPLAHRVLWCLGAIGVLLLAGRAGLTLLRSPCVGVADNLDYWRVARPAGIHVEAATQPGLYVICEYEVGEADPLASLTSPVVIAWFARQINHRLFDLRQVGLVYWGASVIVLAVLLWAGANVLLVLLVAWVLYDPGFLLFFNSLYADPALVLGLVAVVGLLLLDPLWVSDQRREARRSASFSLAALAVGTSLGAGSKMLYAPLTAVLLASCALGFAARRQAPRARQAGFLLALLALAVLTPLHFVYGAAPRFLNANNFNAVFGGIARVSSDPEAALRALHIPEDLLDAQPKSYFRASRQVTAPAVAHVRELSRLRLATLYLTDPLAMLRTVEKLDTELRKVRTHPRGNYTEAESGRNPRTYRTRVQFAIARAHLLNRIPWWPFQLLVLVTFLVLYRAVRDRWQGVDTTCLFLVLWVTSQCVVVVLGDGFVSLQQHLLGARLGLDLLLVLTIGRLLLWASETLQAGRERSRQAPPESDPVSWTPHPVGQGVPDVEESPTVLAGV